MILDTNVVIHLFESDAPAHFYDNIGILLAENDAFVNEIIFAEVAARFSSADTAMEQLEHLGLGLKRLSLADCYHAGIAFGRYRREGRPRTTILSDFLIGAQAAGQGWALVTRDRKGFAKHFPQVRLIDPYEA